MHDQTHSTQLSIPHLRVLLDQIVDYLQAAENLPLVEACPPDVLAEKLAKDMVLDLPDLPQQAGSVEPLSRFVAHYLHYAVNTHHHGFVNQLWSDTLLSSFLGEVLSAATNASAYTYEVAPVATLMEDRLVRQLTQQVWSSVGDGIMTSGGTASNLQALLTARNHHCKDMKFKGMGERRLALFCSADAHYSIKRAANILGLGMEQVIEVEPSRGKSKSRSMDAAGLQLAMDGALADGLEPFCVVATAGTTVYGAYDVITEIADFARQHDLWLHVDGALGASVLFSDEHKVLMRGVERADSLSWDFHKMLGVHLPCAFLLLRQTGVMQSAISTANDDYLFHDDENRFDLGSKSLQCGRRVDVLKLWLSWLAAGRQGFGQRVDKLFALARFVADYIVQSADLVLLMQPVSVNVCFRFRQRDKIGNDIVVRVRDLMIAKGQYMLNYAADQRGPFFRLVLTNAELTEKQLSDFVDTIIQTGKNINVS